MRLLLLSTVVAVGCLPPPPVYQVQRSARMPRPAAPMRTGEPLAGPVGFSLEATGGDNAKLADKRVAIEVPTQQVRGELRIRIKRGEIAPFYEQGVESSYGPLDPTQAPVRDGAATVYGLATRYSIPTPNPRFSIGTSLDLMSYSMPYVEYRTCVENCDVNGIYGTEIERGTESTGTFGFGITPTYRSGALAVYGGVYGRRHPTIERKGTEVGGGYDDTITGGNYNMVLHAGVEVRASIFSFGAAIQQNVTADPVQYGPSLGVTVGLHVPDAKRPRTVRPPEPAPPSSHWLVDARPQPEMIEDDELPDDPWP